MIRRPPRSTRTDTPFPYTTLFRGVGTDYHSQMTLSITSAFDGGNIRVLDISGHRADLEIVKDQNSDFHQWFYFRLAGAAGEEVELRILNCGGAAYPDGWPS